MIVFRLLILYYIVVETLSFGLEDLADFDFDKLKK